MIGGLNQNNRIRSLSNSSSSNPSNPLSQDISVTKQLSDFWAQVGLFTRVCFIVNVGAYLYQVGMKKQLTDQAICLAPVLDYQQYYRVLTSEFSHGNPAHILFNMCGLLVFGVEVEKTYGTLYYAISEIIQNNGKKSYKQQIPTIILNSYTQLLVNLQKQ